MKLENATMYHFHKIGVYDANWNIGNQFNVNDSFNNNLCYGVKTIDNNESLIDQKIDYYKLVEEDFGKFYIREVMLELFRTINFPDCISRMNCMYFCDEKSLLYWSSIFKFGYDLYKVTLNGEAFKSSSKLLPEMNEVYTYEQLEAFCNNYWKPNLMDENLNCFAEYLFQGNVIVKEKLDPEQIRSRYKTNL